MIETDGQLAYSQQYGGGGWNTATNYRAATPPSGAYQQQFELGSVLPNDVSLSGGFFDDSNGQSTSFMDVGGSVSFNAIDGMSFGNESKHNCSKEELLEAGYVMPPNILPQMVPTSPPEQRRVQEKNGIDNWARITFRCLKPPPVKPGPLTIIEMRPDAPPAPPPNIKKVEKPPRQEPDLILRERPPTPPRSDPSTCHVMLPRPPAPRQQTITHICEYPPKPRDIIIERWLPYTYTGPRKVQIKRAPAYVHPTVRDVVITHTPAYVRNHYRIQEFPDPILTDPQAYMQQHGGTLLDKQALKGTLMNELRAKNVASNILEQVEAIFGRPCNKGYQSPNIEPSNPRFDIIPSNARVDIISSNPSPINYPTNVSFNCECFS